MRNIKNAVLYQLNFCLLIPQYPTVTTFPEDFVSCILMLSQGRARLCLNGAKKGTCPLTADPEVRPLILVHCDFNLRIHPARRQLENVFQKPATEAFAVTKREPQGGRNETLSLFMRNTLTLRSEAGAHTPVLPAPE